MTKILLITLLIGQLLSPTTLLSQPMPPRVGDGPQPTSPKKSNVQPGPPGHMQSNPQDNQSRRVRQLEELVAKQQEVIEAMQSELQKFKEKEGGKKR
jgi:hypothetical protein